MHDHAACLDADASDAPNEEIVINGQEYEVLLSIICSKIPDDHFLPNGQLDMSKFTKIA